MTATTKLADVSSMVLPFERLTCLKRNKIQRILSSKTLIPCLSTLLLTIFVTSLQVNGQSRSSSYQAEEVSFKTGEEILAARQFRSETHFIKTPDNHYIHVVRIINPKLRTRRPIKSPVIFVHGVLLSMTSFLVNSKNVKARDYQTKCPLRHGKISHSDELRSLPMALANSGYDVWMLNTRGVGLSTRTTWPRLNANSSEFWNFNLDTMARNEVPAVINYVRTKTGSPTVGYVGHSQGTFIMFAAMSQFPELNQIVRPFVAIAPIMYLEHIVGFSKIFVTTQHLIYEASGRKDDRATVPNMRQNIDTICKTDEKACDLIQTSANGPSNMAAFPSGYVSHIGFPTSFQNFNHYYQLMGGQDFSHYNYGVEGNLRRYGQLTSPKYNVKKLVNKNMVFVYGETDFLSTPDDVHRLISELPVNLLREMHLGPIYNHLDLLASESASIRVNRPILEVFESLNGC